MELLIKCLMTSATDLAPWHALASYLAEQKNPLASWLTQRLRSAPTGNRTLAPAELSEQQLPPHFDELALPAQVLHGLAQDPRIKQLVDLLIDRDDPLVIMRVVCCVQYAWIDALDPLVAVLAKYFERLLDQIANRHVTVRIPFDPKSSVGMMSYQLSNGWQLTIYNRVYQWHYVESFTSPWGDEYDVSTAATAFTALSAIENYQPPDDVLRDVYGF